MQKLLWFFILISLAGCSHFDETPKVVHFPYAPELLKSIQANATNRAPASINLEAEEEKSTRRVYFSSLYHQYLTLGTHLEKKNNIEFCPQFHHDKIEADSFNVPKITLYKKNHVGTEGQNFFPELAFDRRFSLKNYHQLIKNEIDTLCEEGVSDNFYKFDNLVTHYAAKKSFHMSNAAMESVLKIPIFANFYLIKMIENPNVVNFSYPNEKLFIDMTRTHWFDHYVSEASKRRSNFLRNRVVKR